jgi:beta-galactosidase
MDGLVHSDHTPTPGLTEYKKAIEPVQYVGKSGGKARFINRYDFITLDHLTCSFSIVCDGQSPSEATNVPLPSGVGPGETFELDLPSPPDGKAETIVNISFQLKDATPWLESGFEVSNTQIPLRESSEVLLTTSPTTSTPSPEITSISRHTVQIKTPIHTWLFNTLHGTLTSWTKHSTPLLSAAPELTFYRAPTDNDIPQDGWDWKDRLLHLARPSTRKVEIDAPKDGDGEVVITVHQRVAPPVLSWSIDCMLTYRFSSAGLAVHARGTPQGRNLPRTLPRIGLVMEMPREWQGVQWFGRGPGESYRDSKLSQLVGTYAVSSIDELWVDYEVPQESSNRTDTRWLKLRHGKADTELLAQFVETGGEGKRRRTFDWQASHYRMRDVAEAKHPYQLRKKRMEDVVLRLDWQHHGLGSGSCGPRTLDEYSLLTEEFEFQVLLQ